MDLDIVHNADCIEWLNAQPEGWADLIFADPPFNIGYQYDVYEDRKAYDDYYAWTDKWMRACRRAMTSTGAFWVAIGDEYAAEVRMIGRACGLTLRNWVIWTYTFGQCTKAKFARSHAHLFYFTADPKVFTFNDQAVRVFSDRQREYHDKRASPKGKIPDDTWSEFARVCGTFAEREGWHPCQMPTSVLGRIIRACSNPGEVVFDPFSGSGTTLAAAKRLGRRYVGSEFSPNYVEGIRERMRRVTPLAASPAGGNGTWPDGHVEELQNTYAEAAVSTDLLLKHRHLLKAFADFYNWRLANAGVEGEYGMEEINARLAQLRRLHQLPRIRVHVTEGEQRGSAKHRHVEGGQEWPSDSLDPGIGWTLGNRRRVAYTCSGFAGLGATKGMAEWGKVPEDGLRVK